MEFIVPTALEELEEPRDDRMYVGNVVDVETLDAKEAVQSLKDLETTVLDSATALDVLNETTFDLAYSFVKKLGSLSDHVRVRIVRMLSAFVTTVTKSVRDQGVDYENEYGMQYRSAFKATVYLLVMALDGLSKSIDDHKTAKKSSKANSNWVPLVESAVDRLASSLVQSVFRLWETNFPEEEFLALYTRPAIVLLSLPLFAKSNSLKQKLYHLLGKCLKQTPLVRHSPVSSLVDLLRTHEHVVKAIAELTQVVVHDYGVRPFASDILEEVAHVTMGDGPKHGAWEKNCAAFVTELSSRSPVLMIENQSFVLELCDSDSYTCRNAGVTAMAHMLRHASRVQSDRNLGVQESEPSHQDLSKDERDDVIQALKDQAMDGTSYVRSHTLKELTSLVQEAHVPFSSVQSLVELAVDRLQDRSVAVRRQSLNLLTIFLRNNPFMEGMRQTDLDLEAYVSIHTKVQDNVSKLELQLSELPEAEDGDAQALEHRMKKQQELQLASAFCTLCGEAVTFLQCVDDQAKPLVKKLLGSASTSDVLGAMQFFEVGYKLHVKDAQVGIQSMLPLVYRDDPQILDRLTETFVRLFLHSQGAHQKLPKDMARSILMLSKDCSKAEIRCLGKILGDLHAKQELPTSVIAALWDATEEEGEVMAAAAFALLGMLCKRDKKLLLTGERLVDVQEHGFSDVVCRNRGKRLVMTAACSLMQQVPTSPNELEELQTWNLDAIEGIKRQLDQFLKLQVLQDEQLDAGPMWFENVKAATDALFVLEKKPQDAVADILESLSKRLFGTSKVDVYELAHFVFLLGHFALRLLVYIEDKDASIKKLRGLQQKRPKSMMLDEDDDQDEELAMGQTIEADEDEYVRRLIKDHVVTDNVLGRFAPLVLHLIHLHSPDASEGEQQDPLRQDLLLECAVQTLGKYMAVSEDFCKEHLDTLFSTLETASQPLVRANIVVGVGDLAFRFPNLIEPHQPQLYARLHDHDLRVRKNTIVVLSHLALNDMVKMKGRLGDICLSLVDEHESVRSMAQSFFYELANKPGHRVFSMIPDVVSQLSTNAAVSKKDFAKIMKFLMQFVSTGKNVSAIVEKLLERMHKAGTKDEQRDLALCLSHTAHTDKTIEYLLEHRKKYRSALDDKTVLSSFEKIVGRTRHSGGNKELPADMKSSLDRLEAYLDRVKDGLDDMEDALEQDDSLPTPRNKSRRPRKRKRLRNASDSED